ncbi:hypothetical protein HBI70_016980 [Parastagonospora nodorum]|nr:hypothetical protein HBI76_026720 [Parastagonospora nodorum]KAH5287251.1 hypothetical protein HBI70_016980 [Parastagonospora nodorum]KAH5636225.1 hypothetical protein HBI51_167610 [Parastagonospora nodorum]KAH6549889.1 hypothetical protein HBI07_050400 [Parastagonospora nodorum]
MPVRIGKAVTLLHGYVMRLEVTLSDWRNGYPRRHDRVDLLCHIMLHMRERDIELRGRKQCSSHELHRWALEDHQAIANFAAVQYQGAHSFVTITAHKDLCHIERVGICDTATVRGSASIHGCLKSIDCIPFPPWHRGCPDMDATSSSTH